MTSATATTGRVSATSLVRRLGPVTGEGPTYRRVADRIRAATLNGRLTVGIGLPSERDLAMALGVSRTTVAAAYQQLRDDGWLSSRRGSGSRLAIPREHAAWRSDIFGAPAIADEPALIDLTTASLPAPAEPLQRAVEAATGELPGYAAGSGYFPFGLPVLRDQVAQRYCDAGVPTTAEHILITGGAQHAFGLALSSLTSPGDRVLLECPTYPVALDAIRAAHRVPTPLPLGDNADTAWDLELFGAILRQSAARVSYLIPDFQNPTGALMSAADRERAVEQARRTGGTLLVDESFRDVPFGVAGSDQLPPPMSAFGDGATGRGRGGSGCPVISLGSVSKAFWGGLRIGWVRATPAIVERLAVTRSLGDMAGPVLDQLIVSHLLADPAAALEQQSARLAAGAAAVRAALAEYLPDWSATDPAGGASLWVRLPGPYATELARLAPAAGVRVVPGPRFGPDGTMEACLRLPFTAPPEQLTEAIRRLSQIDRTAAQGAVTAFPGWLA
ncbi:MocR-like transcription factor YczR [Nakamurella lactea]|uniref:MocR-like transcription factor YczR n=1 Tax=Nakamurella lactea TaxID=459515 RepID=UPI00041F866B|nr:PLP-dependent aminotransferase family protein [Nakamurella lactea]